MNPHVSPQEPRPKLQPNGGVPLPDAIKYANGVRDAYYCAVGDQSILRNGVAIAAISMAGAALGLGITGGPTEVITGLGVGGASTFGVGTFLYSDARQRVYLAGSEAVGCAILAMSPLVIDAADLTRFKGDLGTLDGSIGALNSQIQVVDPIAAHATGSTKTRADTALERAKSVATQADQMSREGHLLANRIETAGITLVTAVDTIRDKVSVQITRTEPDLQAIATIVGGLGSAVSRFTPTVPAAAAGAAPETPQESFGAIPVLDPIEVLESLTNEVVRRMAAVAPLINSVAAATQKVGTIEACKVADVDTTFSITPDVTSVDIKPGETVQFATKGGSGAPRVALVGSKVDGLTAEAPLGSTTVLLVADSKTKADSTATLVITDGTGKQSKTITVKVKAAAK